MKREASASVLKYGFALWIGVLIAPLQLFAQGKSWDPEFRSKQIHLIDYKFSLQVSDTQEHWTSQSQIKFELKEKNQPLALDLHQATIRRIIINGEPSARFFYNNGHILIPADAFKSGKNLVQVDAEGAYRPNSAEGLLRLRSGSGNEVAIVTGTYPQGLSYIFACFDQSDLKAPVTLDITMPSKWTSVSISPGKSHIGADGQTTYSYSAEENLAPDAIGFVAGTLQTWEQRSGNKNIRIISSPSINLAPEYNQLAAFIDRLTKHLEETTFPSYPFTKVDFIVLPNNLPYSQSFASAIILPFKKTPLVEASENQRLRDQLELGRLLIRQWLGIHVSPVTWDEGVKWEALQTLIAAENLSELFHQPTIFPLLWLRSIGTTLDQEPFTINRLPAAFTQIPAHARDEILLPWVTKNIFSIRALLKSNEEEDWKKITQIFVNRRGTSAVPFSEILKMYQEAAQDNKKSSWKENLDAIDLPEFDISLQCYKGRITEIALIQSKQADRRFDLNFHEITLLSNNGRGGIIPRNTFKVSAKGSTTKILEAQGMPCPIMVIPNLSFSQYARYNLDEKTLEAIQTSIGRVDDVSLRLSLWNHLWLMTLEGKIAPQQFALMVQKNLRDEKETVVIESVSPMIRIWLTHANEFQEPIQPDTLAWEQYLETTIKTVATNPKLNDTWRKIYFEIGESMKVQLKIGNYLQESMDKKRAFSTLWPFVVKLGALASPASETFKTTLIAQSDALTDKTWLTALNLAHPDYKKKRQFLASVLEGRETTNWDDLEIILKEAFPTNQQEMRNRWVREFWPHLVDAENPYDELRTYQLMKHSMPHPCREDTLIQLISWQTKLTRPLSRLVLDRVITQTKTCLGMDFASQKNHN